MSIFKALNRGQYRTRPPLINKKSYLIWQRSQNHTPIPKEKG